MSDFNAEPGYVTSRRLRRLSVEKHPDHSVLVAFWIIGIGILLGVYFMVTDQLKIVPLLLVSALLWAYVISTLMHRDVAVRRKNYVAEALQAEFDSDLAHPIDLSPGLRDFHHSSRAYGFGHARSR